MAISPDSIRKFLDLQYGEDSGVAWIGAKTGNTFSDKGFTWPAEKDQLIEYIVGVNSNGGNVWFAAHLSHSKKPKSEGGLGRAKGQSVKRRRLHVDIDRELTDEDRTKIEQLDAWVVYSGSPGHVHAYVELDRSVDVGTYHKLEDMLVSWFGSDQAVCRDNGLLRIPGTVNQMGGKKTHPPAPVTWDETRHVRCRQWEPESLLALIPGHVVEKVAAKSEASESFGQNPIEIQQVEIPKLVMDAILTHWDDRSAKTANLVNTCKAVGLSLGATLFCVLGDEGQRQRYREKGYAFMFREIRKLYGTADDFNPQLREQQDDAALGMAGLSVGDRVSVPLTTEAGLEGARVLSEQEQDELDTQLLMGMTVVAPSGPLTAQQQVENALARSSWGPMDFSGVLDGTYQAPQPTMFTRTDGVSLLYPGLTHSFHGEPESGKSLIAQIECIHQINGGRDVLYIDFEDGMTGVISRFIEFGADPTMLRQHLAYVRPHENFNAEAPEWQKLMQRRFALAVLDGVTESMSLTGHELNDNSDIAKWQQMLPNTIARETGAAVVIIDHVTKSNEGRGRAAIGGQHKLAGLSGAAYLIEIDQPLGRGNHGIVVMRLAKDRPGYLRERCGEYRKGDRTQEAARVIVDSTTCGLTGKAPDVTVSPWEAVITEEQREAALARSIFDCVSHNPGINRRMLQEKLRSSGIKFKTTVLGPTLTDMVGMEQLRTEKGPHNSVEYHAGIWGQE